MLFCSYYNFSIQRDLNLTSSACSLTFIQKRLRINFSIPFGIGLLAMPFRLDYAKQYINKKMVRGPNFSFRGPPHCLGTAIQQNK